MFIIKVKVEIEWGGTLLLGKYIFLNIWITRYHKCVV